MMFLVFRATQTYCAYSIVDVFPNSNGHRAVLSFNGVNYSRLFAYNGYYIWDDARKQPIGEVKPPLFYRFFNEKWYIYTFDDPENSFVVVCLNETNNGDFVTKKYYRDDIKLPAIDSDSIKSIEIVSVEKELFNPDYSMNDCKSDASITDSSIIEEILNGLEPDAEKKRSKEALDTVLSDSYYYVIATFKNAPEKLCYLIGGLKVMNDSVGIFYNQVPEDIEFEQ